MARKRKSRFHCGQYMFSMADAMEMAKQSRNKKRAVRRKESKGNE